MKRRIISMLLVVAMAVALVPQWLLGASAADVVVTNGEKSYDSLNEAVAAAVAGDTLKLQADINEGFTVDKDICLDLNGFDINGTVVVSDGVKAYGMDSKTCDITVDEEGYGEIAEYTGELLAGDGYAMIGVESGYSFHYIE